ncbi:hypothetical protein ABZX65_07440 [Streptomyces sp. NPDC003300]|uniref:hypothetical protein n=1 Tax=unclassified Streptomyces TaxID=2593676 RepID=UPI0033A3420F
MADIRALIEQLHFLIGSSQTYVANDGWTFSSGDQSDPVALCNRLDSAIERIALPGSPYIKQLEAARRLPQPYKLTETRAVALGLRDDMIAGWFTSTVELVHAETHSDYLEMSETLLRSGYKDAAAVIAGTALEVHIRALCVKHGVDTEVADGAPKKATAMNAELKKADVYATLQEKQVTAWMDLRNQAAHGNYKKYEINEVRALASGVREFMLRYPA